MPNVKDADRAFAYTIENLVQMIGHDLNEDLWPSGRSAALWMAGCDLDGLQKSGGDPSRAFRERRSR
jgi:hypothetical protein